MDEEIEKQLNEMLSLVLKDYYNYLDLNSIDVDIIFAERISDVYIKKRPELFEEIALYPKKWWRQIED